MPAPSSLWGRLRGKYDIAFFTGQYFTSHFLQTLLKPSHHLHWRFKKRACLKKHSCSPDFYDHPPEINVGEKDILLIDDIMTTGTTCFQTIRAHPTKDFHIFTLADSYRRN